MNKKIILATGQYSINQVFQDFDDYEIVNIIEHKSDIRNLNIENVDIVLFSEGLLGDEHLIGEILELSKENPDLRIIYLAGQVDGRDKAKINSLGLLVMSGIYDIVTERKMTKSSLKGILDNPKSHDSVSYLAKGFKKDSSVNDLIELGEEIVKEEERQEHYDNVYTFSSSKPGTGKTYISTNVAVGIAEYGVKIDGKKPKVAIIEADLQNLSVGTVLQVEGDKYNLKTVMDRIGEIIDREGNMVGTLEETEKVDKFIKKCLKPYKYAKNLEAMVGSELKFEEIENMKSFHYIYLIESIIDYYDVVLIDTNSSLAHITTYPLLKMAKTNYFIMNLDFNNVRNNIRYQSTLEEIGIKHKVKYILNEDIKNDPSKYDFAGVEVEELIYTSELLEDSTNFNLVAKVPELPKTVFLNRLYEGKPVVLDDKKYTLESKYQLLKIANEIWAIENFSKIKEKALKAREKNKKSGFFNFGK